MTVLVLNRRRVPFSVTELHRPANDKRGWALCPAANDDFISDGGMPA